MKKKHYLTADYEKAATALTHEIFSGNVHLDITERVAAMEPMLGNCAPTFFVYTYYAHLNAAQLYAHKLFDSHNESFTIPRFLEMSRMRLNDFRNSTPTEVKEYLDQLDTVITNLRPVTKILKDRRNQYIAHISHTLAFNREHLMQGPPLMPAQIREVFTVSGRIVNGLLHFWNNSWHQIEDKRTDDFKKLTKMMCKQLNAQADEDEAEAARGGVPGFKVPRPTCD